MSHNHGGFVYRTSTWVLWCFVLTNLIVGIHSRLVQYLYSLYLLTTVPTSSFFLRISSLSLSLYIHLLLSSSRSTVLLPLSPSIHFDYSAHATGNFTLMSKMSMSRCIYFDYFVDHLCLCIACKMSHVKFPLILTWPNKIELNWIDRPC